MLTGLLVLFLAIAVYSPLHQHQVGKPFDCSLNNIDQREREIELLLDYCKRTGQ